MERYQAQYRGCDIQLWSHFFGSEQIVDVDNFDIASMGNVLADHCNALFNRKSETGTVPIRPLEIKGKGLIPDKRAELNKIISDQQLKDLDKIPVA